MKESQAGPLFVLFFAVDKQTFLKVRKSQIRNLLGSFRSRKSAKFLSVTVIKSQIRNFWAHSAIANRQNSSVW